MSAETDAEEKKEARHHHDRNEDFGREMNIVAIKNADLALRTAILINGGAAVAVLAFLGGLAAKGDGDGHIALSHIGAASSTLAWFAYGVASAAVGMGFAYVANISIAADAFRRKKTSAHPFLADTNVSKRLALYSKIFKWGGVFFWIASIGCFIIGMREVKDAFAHL